MKLTATIAASRPQKYCKKHNKMYIIDKEFSLCCHSDCFGSAVRTNLKGSQIYQHIVRLGVLEDFYSYIQLHLLAELREKNKPPILNFRWLFFKSMMFYASLRKGIVPYNDLPSKARDDCFHVELEEDIVGEITDINSAAAALAKSSLTKVLTAELVSTVSEMVGPVITSYLLGEINEIEVARIHKTNLKGARQLIEESKLILKDFFTNQV
jgi:hypothetical protein